VLRKRFFDPLAFITAVNARLGVAMRYLYLKTIELSFTNEQYFDFFGVQLKSQLTVDGQST
jgi:hypothetical protein